MPIISIIIPIYNSESYLRRCLDSIICQDFQDCEIILIDDGSTDGSATMCQHYSSKYDNIIFIHKENGGVSSARNAGLDIAQGDYICFIDSDDWVESTYLQTLRSYVKNENSIDILFFSMFLCSSDKKEIISLSNSICKNRQAVENEIYALRYAGERDVFGWTWDKIFKADIIRKWHIRFHEDVSFREDELFTFEFCRHIMSLQTIDLPLYNYRISNSGLTIKGMRPTDYLPSSISLENTIPYFKHEGIRENMLHSITSYRALHIYKQCSISQVKIALKEYQQLTLRHPQPGRRCPIQHLTQYLKKGFLFAYLYCLLRKI